MLGDIRFDILDTSANRLQLIRVTVPVDTDEK